MKRIVLLITFIAAIALCASGQTYVNFQDMPMAWVPTPMPDNYPEGMYLNWDSFLYVTPGIWAGEGAGFWVDPSTQHNTVAFMGGPMCALTVPCTASIKMSSIMMSPFVRTFTPTSITVSAGWLANTVTVLAYNNGKFVGSLQWQLKIVPQTFTFPAAWTVTQLVFTPGVINANSVKPIIGSVVIYNFSLMTN
jgi:hypothetical protein